MSTFTSKLGVSPLTCHDGKPRWALEEDFSYYTDWPSNQEVQLAILKAHERIPDFIEVNDRRLWIHVPKHYTTDFASVPRFLWWLLPPYHPDYGKAAVIHDFCYEFHIGTRKWADKEFRSGMTVLGAPRWKRNLMYPAVRLCGWVPYKKNVPPDAEELG